MSGWDRFGRHIAKGFFWAAGYYAAAWGFNVPNSIQLLLFTIACIIWSDILNGLLPTEDKV